MQREDTGQGFPQETLPRAFQKFYRGDASRSKHNGNAGLGLYIAKLLIEKHGGIIQARNGEKAGAIVAFTLPLLHTHQVTS